MDKDKKAKENERKKKEKEKEIARRKREEQLDEGLDETFPASDPPSTSRPGGK